MTRKKEAKELIEILLRQQQEKGRERNDPLEGIEWGGLPPELQDRVYRPPEREEPLIEFLTSTFEGESPAVREEAPKVREPDPPESREAVEPERPGWKRWVTASLFDLFAFLNRTYEVRVATLVAFGTAAIFFSGLCYLVGAARARVSLQVLEPRGSAGELAYIPPARNARRPVRSVTAAGSGEGNVRLAEAGPAKTAEARPAPAAAKKRGPVYSIRIMTVGDEKAARDVCLRLSEGGLARFEPRYWYKEAEGWIVVIGRWESRNDALSAFAELRRSVFPALKAARVLTRLDQLVFRNDGNR